MLKKIRHIIIFILILPVYFIIRNLPLYCLYKIAGLLSSIAMLFPFITKMIIANLSVCFPEKTLCELRKLTRENIKNIILISFETIWFYKKKERLEKYVFIEDETKEIFKEYYKSKQGLVLVAPHLGNWELANLVIQTKTDFTLAVVAQNIKNPFIRKFVTSLRTSEGGKVIPAKGAIKGMIKALKEKMITGTLIDQNTKLSEGGVFVDFFDLPVPTSPAPAWFSKKLKIPSLIVVCIRENGRYMLVAKKIKKFSEYESEKDMIQDIMRINQNLIMSYPEQYLWLYKRFFFIPHNANKETIEKFPYYAKNASKRFYGKHYDNI